MKIVNIIGGLGNQMFEYALYLALKNAHPNENIFVQLIVLMVTSCIMDTN